MPLTGSIVKDIIREEKPNPQKIYLILFFWLLSVLRAMA